MTLVQSVKQKKLYLILSITVCLGVLGFFKYYNFFRESFNALSILGWLELPWLDIILPVGISFFTFQAISYIIDVYRGEIQVDYSKRGLLDYLVYIAFFPQLVAGPIIRARVFLPQFKSSYTKRIPNMHLAFFLILGGLFKKVIMSTYLEINIIGNVLNTPHNYSPIELLLAIYAFSVQIYCDFSGYTDIAIGTALLLGFRFPDNFNNPYQAVNIQDFWRRWHITLSTWLRDYLYIPLGGNRKGEIYLYVNIMITMLLGGLWHGPSLSYIVWGGLHGLAIVLYKLWKKIKEKTNIGFKSKRLSKAISIIVTFHIVSFLWVFFYHTDFSNAISVFSALINFNNPLTGLDLYVVLIIIIGIGIHFYGDQLQEKYLKIQHSVPYFVQLVHNAIWFILIIKITPDIPVPPYIYFQF